MAYNVSILAYILQLCYAYLILRRVPYRLYYIEFSTWTIMLSVNKDSLFYFQSLYFKSLYFIILCTISIIVICYSVSFGSECALNLGKYSHELEDTAYSSTVQVF